ncbi:MAG: mitofilin family membrane protein, partial [Pseudomonadota bacterium]
EIPASRQAAASLALLALQRAFDEGEPYTEQLAVLTRLAPEAEGVEALRASASEGAPTLASLKAQFTPAVRNALAVSSGDGDNGLVSRVQKLVSVRPATPQPGEEPSAVISRAEANLDQDDLGGAVEELLALSDGAADAFSGWLEAAQRRLTAAEAIETLNAALLDEYENQ